MPAPVTFSCYLAELDDEVLAAVAGDLDLAVIDEFRRCLGAASLPGKPLFLDLTGVTFIGGAAYRAIAVVAAALPVTAATHSGLIATVLQSAPRTTIRVQLGLSEPDAGTSKPF